jgi:ZIP family zinc transporter
MEAMLIGGLSSSMATGLGALFVLFFHKATHHLKDILLAYTAGIMMTASTYGLIPSALKESNVLVVCIGILTGTLVLTLLESMLPHHDLEHKRKPSVDQRSWMIIIAITLHNIPEGLSVGVSYSSAVTELGPLVALSIGLQNAPEGLLVALFLVQQKVSPWIAILFSTLTGLLEFAAGFAGYYLTSYVDNLGPYGLSFAAGAMLFIVYKELIPESHGDGHETGATISFILGLLTIIIVTEWLGQ